MSREAPAERADPEDLIERIRYIVGSAALDCDCRSRVNEALERFVKMERQRETRRHLLSSRQHRAAIAALVELLAELEEIGWQEMDRTVFSELAHLFEDIAQHAQSGAQELRQLEKTVAP
ncbi:MAG: hypothetical protein KIS86_00435 [Devosia sp.]|nr:hypothetical protein [Devosia sp.]